MSSLTTTILNLLFAEAEQMGKTRNYRTNIGLGLDGSSADKLSLDLKFDPWDTAISVRLEWHSMSKTVFNSTTHPNPGALSSKTRGSVTSRLFHHRPFRCLIVVHPYFLTHWDTNLLAESAPRAKNMHRRLMFFARPVRTQARNVEQETEERNIQQRGIRHRSEPSLVEFVDQRHFARSNNKMHDGSRD